MSPTVAVVMAAYNAAEYLGDSIDSILSQTYTDFELIVVNDGSTDGSDALIGAFADPRIISFHRRRNQGKPAALNWALKHTQARYVAMMDADDIALPSRLASQVAYLEKHPHVGILGGRMQRFGTASGLTNVLVRHAEIHASLLFNNPMANPTVMLRRSLLTHFSPPFKDYFPLEDYDLWIRMQNKGCFANLNQVLLRYRIGPQNHSLRLKEHVARLKLQIFEQALKAFGIRFSPFELLLHATAGTRRMPATPTIIRAYLHWLARICAHNRQTGHYNQIFLEQAAQRRWKKLFYRLPPRNILSLATYWRLSGCIRRRHLPYLIRHWIPMRRQHNGPSGGTPKRQ